VVVVGWKEQQVAGQATCASCQGSGVAVNGHWSVIVYYSGEATLCLLQTVRQHAGGLGASPIA
jgi:hypothetical protein